MVYSILHLEPYTDLSLVHVHQQRVQEYVTHLKNLGRRVPVGRLPYTEPSQRHSFGPMNVECPHCQALHWPAERLKHSSARHPQFGFCCNSGQVQIPLPKEPPSEYKEILDDTGVFGRIFRDKIRMFNAVLSFTSLGVQVDESINRRGHGPYVFKIHGELCHLVGSLLPIEGRQPSYAQLYIYDPHSALQHRVERNGLLGDDHQRERELLEKLQAIINQCHPYARILKNATAILQEHTTTDDVSIRLHFNSRHHEDKRRYNLPSADEVAVILPGSGEQEHDRRDIVLHKRSGQLQRIHDGHPAYAPLHYVLLFPYGDHGWHKDIPLSRSDGGEERHVTQTRFYAYQLQVRRGYYSTILRGGRLLQQYIVDAWASSDQNTLNWYRHNQGSIRAALYSGLEDAVARADDDIHINPQNLGQRFILPSSYQGGQRYMHQLLQDALAIGREFRKINLFITVTCNPDWPEIAQELYSMQTPSDRADLIARVFHLKKKLFLMIS